MRPSGVAGSRQVVSLWQLLNKTYDGFRVFNFIYKKMIYMLLNLWSVTQGLAQSMRPSGVAGSRQVMSLWQLLCKTYVGFRVFNFFYQK